jgi:hypothetical protein
MVPLVQGPPLTKALGGSGPSLRLPTAALFTHSARSAKSSGLQGPHPPRPAGRCSLEPSTGAARQADVSNARGRRRRDADRRRGPAPRTAAPIERAVPFAGAIDVGAGARRVCRVAALAVLLRCATRCHVVRRQGPRMTGLRRSSAAFQRRVTSCGSPTCGDRSLRCDTAGLRPPSRTAASWSFNAPSTCDQLDATFRNLDLDRLPRTCIFQPHVHELRWQPIAARQMCAGHQLIVKVRVLGRP